MKFSKTIALNVIRVIHQVSNKDLMHSEQKILGFRGTNSLLDLKQDLSFAQDTFGKGKVHSGILEMYNEIDFTYSFSHPILGGHSMGGVLAALHAFSMAKRGESVEGVYLFGMPKFCDSNFQKEYNSLVGDKTFVVNNRHDVITKLPPLFSYTSVGTPYSLDFDFGSFQENHCLKNYEYVLGESLEGTKRNGIGES